MVDAIEHRHAEHATSMRSSAGSTSRRGGSIFNRRPWVSFASAATLTQRERARRIKTSAGLHHLTRIRRGIPLQEIGARLGKVLGCWRKQFEGVTIGIIKVQRPARHPTVEDGPDNLDTFLLE